MEYRLIKGTFHVVGHSPDGDSIKFRANNIARWDKIQADDPDKFEEALEKENGVVQLRLQGIDALETHYAPPFYSAPKDLRDEDKKRREERPEAGNHEQPEALGQEATNEFLRYLGVNKIKWRKFGRAKWIDEAHIQQGKKEVIVEDKYQDDIPGFIIAKEAEKNGRPISWIFAGSTSERDGSIITNDELANMVEQSANYHLLRTGLVYPYFYMTLSAKTRNKLAEATQLAQLDAKELLKQYGNKLDELPQKLPNLWVYDKTCSEEGTRISNVEQVNHDSELWPYLFRKLLKQWHKNNLERYWEALRTDEAFDSRRNNRVQLKSFFDNGNPYVLIVSETEFVRLDQIVEIKGYTLKMLREPWDIVFLS